MIKYLERTCPNCKNIIRLVQKDGKLTTFSGARPYKCYKYYATYNSDKTVVCQGTFTTGKFDRGFTCNNWLQVRKFKEFTP